ncbi:MAG: hypothetical protein MZV63_72480 [Marinilabiliales bacterium]|nr:hypothetical protein [Marinilabiliales bacterium]
MIFISPILQLAPARLRRQPRRHATSPRSSATWTARRPAATSSTTSSIRATSRSEARVERMDGDRPLPRQRPTRPWPSSSPGASATRWPAAGRPRS